VVKMEEYRIVSYLIRQVSAFLQLRYAVGCNHSLLLSEKSRAECYHHPFSLKFLSQSTGGQSKRMETRRGGAML